MLLCTNVPATCARDGAVDKTAHDRLIAAAGSQAGVYHAAVEIALAPDAVTYWRQPGEAGVPPRFSFEGSENVASTEVLYPVPGRFDESGVEAIGYRGGVVFPIHVTPRDPGKATVLKLTLDYAVCETICVPVRSDAEIELPATSGENNVVAAAEARVPIALSPDAFRAKATIVPVPGTAKPTWTLTWQNGSDLKDAFAEAPEGWYFETHKVSANVFALEAVETPAGGAGAPVDIRLTAVGSRQAYEAKVTLPAAPVTSQ